MTISCNFTSKGFFPFHETFKAEDPFADSFESVNGAIVYGVAAAVTVLVEVVAVAVTVLVEVVAVVAIAAVGDVAVFLILLPV